MSYFSQRKKHERENIFLKVMLIILGGLTIVHFFENETYLGDWVVTPWRFQIFIIITLIFIIAIWLQRFAYAFVAVLLLLINFTFLSSTANLFNNSSVVAEHKLTLTLQENGKAKIEGSNIIVLRSGRINVTPHNQAHFTSIEKNFHVFTIISLDFSTLNAQEKQQAFHNLEEFIHTQDDPVIVIGNFGLPVWSSIFEKFLIKTRLEVKNKVLLANTQSSFSPFAVPGFNVLAFKNIGIMDLKILKTPSHHYTLQTVLGFY